MIIFSESSRFKDFPLTFYGDFNSLKNKRETSPTPQSQGFEYFRGNINRILLCVSCIIQYSILERNYAIIQIYDNNLFKVHFPFFVIISWGF